MPNNIILLWPKDANINPAAIEETIKPDRGDGHIRVTNIDTPSMQYFPAPNSTEPAPVVILCPGGGYSYLVVSKMTELATWLNEHGVSAFVLKYRTPKRREAALRDAQRAIRIVRSRASEWNIDPNRIGIMGSSAGGHLAARASTSFDKETYPKSDKIDDASCKPDFTVLLYPAYMNRKDALAPEFAVSNKISPTLIISARDDKNYFPGSPIYAKALKDAGLSIRVHFFEKGGHGFGLRPKQAPLSTWPDLFLQWLKDIGALERATEQKNAPDKK
jgi:acetyl esterase/lipase